MASKASVINAALNHIGEPDSQAPETSDDTWVKRIRDRYADKVRLLFEKHPWNFCSQVEQLAASEPTPAGWAFGFNKPAKCWRILRVTDSLGNMDPRYRTIPYEDQAGRVLTNQETTYLKYIDGTWLDLVGSWPQVFADAVSAELAYAVAPVTEGNGGVLERIKRDHMQAVRAAKNWDAMQQPRWQEPPSRWQVGRFGTRYGRWGENG